MEEKIVWDNSIPKHFDVPLSGFSKVISLASRKHGAEGGKELVLRCFVSKHMGGRMFANMSLAVFQKVRKLLMCRYFDCVYGELSTLLGENDVTERCIDFV